jgi:hypothetical protein
VAAGATARRGQARPHTLAGADLDPGNDAGVVHLDNLAVMQRQRLAGWLDGRVRRDGGDHRGAVELHLVADEGEGRLECSFQLRLVADRFDEKELRPDIHPEIPGGVELGPLLRWHGREEADDHDNRLLIENAKALREIGETGARLDRRGDGCTFELKDLRLRQGGPEVLGDADAVLPDEEHLRIGNREGDHQALDFFPLVWFRHHFRGRQKRRNQRGHCRGHGLLP